MYKRQFFVIEADEYDTAFFDKRSKFVHYQPRTLILNNLEFDHADIFEDLPAIQKQFHHLLRTVPGNGLIVQNHGEAALQTVIEMGCWTPREYFSIAGDAGWSLGSGSGERSSFQVQLDGKTVCSCKLLLPGQHNQLNAVAAAAAARHAGVPVNVALDALGRFQGVKRRMELRGQVKGISVFDDFAHHPTAIRLTLDALRQQVGGRRILVALEPRSNTMRMGVHRQQLAPSLMAADHVYLYQPPDTSWAMDEVASEIGEHAACFRDIVGLMEAIAREARAEDSILVMSNGGFENIPQRLLERLA